jgi:hypothetical protein
MPFQPSPAENPSAGPLTERFPARRLTECSSAQQLPECSSVRLRSEHSVVRPGTDQWSVKSWIEVSFLRPWGDQLSQLVEVGQFEVA